MRIKEYLQLKDDLNHFLEQVFSYYDEQKNIYINKKTIVKVKTEYETLMKRHDELSKSYMFFYKFLLAHKVSKLKYLVDGLTKHAQYNNKVYLDKKSSKISSEIKRVGEYKLDENQFNSILVDEDNVLVLAGAGTGKTTTITGKVKYLLMEEKVNPSEILVLTYTKAATGEMNKRIKNETGVDLDVFTFHKLGRKILKEVEGKSPKLTSLEISNFVRSSLISFMKEDSTYLHKVVNYLYLYQYQLKAKNDFKSKFDYEEYIKNNPLVTVKNERVKSEEEIKIANFLYMNGIEYVYEKEYKQEEVTNYHPDFYLTQYDIWIEHFGIDEDGNVPSFFQGVGGMSAKDSYNSSIKWKRNIHKRYNTKLIETYSYENASGELLDKLHEKLEAAGVKLMPIDNKYLISEFNKYNRSTYNALNELFVTVINLLKMNSYSPTYFMSIDMDYGSSLLRDLIVPIYDNYCKLLNDFDEIDYSDMLTRACSYINAGRYKSKYKYVIVDEAQDMSKLTFSLLCELRVSNYYKLFAVGDDWQSIYRFAGSNISYITRFEDYFGLAETFVIPNTYRYSQSIANISGNFIMKNPNQLKKNIYSFKNNKIFDLELIEGEGRYECSKYLKETLLNLPKKADVLFLGRYRGDINILGEEFEYDSDYNSNNNKVILKNRKDLSIKFRTIHTAKGLESDYVFVINNRNESYGFPSKIQDNNLINYLLEKQDLYPYSEERRLFYVALTRTKNKTYLVVDTSNESSFIAELRINYPAYFNKVENVCPKCGSKLKLRNGKHGPFFGCSSYPNCQYTKSISK